MINGNLVKLKMKDVTGVKKYDDHVFLNTGSPHRVQFESDLEQSDIKFKGAQIRYSAAYKEAGTNVNFVKKENILLDSK